MKETKFKDLKIKREVHRRLKSFVAQNEFKTFSDAITQLLDDYNGIIR